MTTLMGLVVCGSIKPIPAEIGGPYVGQIYASANTIANLAGIVGSVLTGRLLDLGPVNQIETWYPVFALNGLCIVVGCCVYFLGGFKPIEWTSARLEYEAIDTTGS